MSVSRNVATVLLERVFDNYLRELGDDAQIVGRERRERVSQLAWCGGGCFDSRRRVNSDVMLHRLWR